MFIFNINITFPQFTTQISTKGRFFHHQPPLLLFLLFLTLPVFSHILPNTIFLTLFLLSDLQIGSVFLSELELHYDLNYICYIHFDFGSQGLSVHMGI